MQYGDIDYMIREKDFTYDPVNFKGLPEFVRSIKKDGLRYIIILVRVLICLFCFFCLLCFFPVLRNGVEMRECHSRKLLDLFP